MIKKPQTNDLKYVIGNIGGSAERIKLATAFVLSDMRARKQYKQQPKVRCTIVYAGNIIDPFNAGRSLAALKAASRKLESIEGDAIKRVFLLGAAESFFNLALIHRQSFEAMPIMMGQLGPFQKELLSAAQALHAKMDKTGRALLNRMVPYYREENFWFASVANDKPPESFGIIGAAPPAPVIPVSADTINLNLTGFNGAVVLQLDRDKPLQMSFIADTQETISRRDQALPLPLIPGHLTFVGYTGSDEQNRLVRASLDPALFDPG